MATDEPTGQIEPNDELSISVEDLVKPGDVASVEVLPVEALVGPGGSYADPDANKVDQSDLEETIRLGRESVTKKITYALLALFIFHGLVMALLYAGVAIATLADLVEMEVATTILLDGIRTIMPITTAFLGVALGFYFRQEAFA